MTPITDAQVEAVARRYCVLMGLDPDAVVGGLQDVTIRHDRNSGSISYGCTTAPKWMTYRPQARAALEAAAIARAVREVGYDSPPETMT